MLILLGTSKTSRIQNFKSPFPAPLSLYGSNLSLLSSFYQISAPICNHQIIHTKKGGGGGLVDHGFLSQSLITTINPCFTTTITMIWVRSSVSEERKSVSLSVPKEPPSDFITSLSSDKIFCLMILEPKVINLKTHNINFLFLDWSLLKILPFIFNQKKKFFIYNLTGN